MATRDGRFTVNHGASLFGHRPGAMGAMGAVKPKLLVSVRCAGEAREAIAGGAEVIDIKEPSRGALGMARCSRMKDILDAVAGRAPVTAAVGELGEWENTEGPALPDGLTVVKVGLAGEAHRRGWRGRLDRFARRLRMGLVGVAYADFVEAGSPPVEAVLDWAIGHAAPALLLDTAVKNGSSLLDHVRPIALRELIRRAHRHDVAVALAGSLRADSIRVIVEMGADVVAVRGGACAGGDREARVREDRVARLCALITDATAAKASCAS